MSEVKLTVFTPTYNRDKYITRFIAWHQKCAYIVLQLESY